ncbi:MAG TPA: hypothetical protein PLW88_07570 [Syntrophorhabdaceae bacterium]|nr:hypothetical protein [Syntrophorhabdaceae bacterium]HPP07215.1 hypothetical protein [Syntrophorhabdaceae bacterium]
MPTKKAKKSQLRGNKEIKVNIKSILYIVGILMLALVIYLFFRGEDGLHKVFLTKGQAKKQFEEKTLETVSIPPVEKARLELISQDKDIVRVVIEKKIPELEYRFQWKINGKIIEDYNKDSISDFKEGDTIGVTVTPIWKEKEGQPRFLSLTIHSTVPKVLGMSEPKIVNDIMVFKILTDDTIKGELIYSLIEAPKGMIIDDKTGEIKWNIKGMSSGRYEGKALIKNKKGAEVLYPFSINLD